jgi:cellobiose-specific phosphotransferase system component IIC
VVEKGQHRTVYQVAITANALGTVTTSRPWGIPAIMGGTEFFNTNFDSTATGTVTIAGNPAG